MDNNGMDKHLKVCCDDLLEVVKSDFLGFELETREVHVEGCCHHCYVLVNVRFCPFCGTPIQVAWPVPQE